MSIKISHLVLTTALSTICISGFAAHKQSTSIQGNPIDRQDSYTVNSAQEQTATIECTFINNSTSSPAKLNIWTGPDQTTPFQTISVAQASADKPATKAVQYHFPLTKEWWCQLYTPPTAKSATYCHFFSISDATIVKNNPFGVWNTTERSHKMAYQCKLTQSKDASFYFFE